MVEWVWRSTGRAWLSELRAALGCRNRVSIEIHLEAVIERVWRCTWRRQSSEFGNACGCLDRVNQRCAWRAWLREFGDWLGGHDRASLEKYLEAVNRRRTRCWDSIHELVESQLWECDEVTLPLTYHGELAGGCRACMEARWELKLHSGVISHPWECDEVTITVSSHGDLAGSGPSCRGACRNTEASFRGQLVIVRMKGRQTILGGCCTWCMLYTVLIDDHGMER